jgi:ferredoxin-NADP reductase
MVPEMLYFVCGPPSMVAEIPEALQALGASDHQIRTERW